MRTVSAVVVAVAALGVLATAQAPRPRHNRVIELLEQKQKVFGLYAPSNRRGGPPGAARPAATPETPPKSPADLARDAAAYKRSDFVFDGSMEGDFDHRLSDLRRVREGTRRRRRRREGAARAPDAPDDREGARDRARPGGRRRQHRPQLNQGVSGVMLVSVETAEEARQGIAAMRFKSKGGTRPDGDVGMAPAVWGTERGGVPRQGRPVAAQPGRRTHQLDHRREQEGPGEPARDRRRAGHRRAVAWRRHAARASSRPPRPPASACSTRSAGRPPSRTCCRRAASSSWRAASRPPPRHRAADDAGVQRCS